jgi:hypothetical protein
MISYLVKWDMEEAQVIGDCLHNLIFWHATEVVLFCLNIIFMPGYARNMTQKGSSNHNKIYF